MRTVGIFQAKNQLSELVAQVEAGEEVTLTRHGKPVAVIRSVARQDAAAEKDANGWPVGYFERTFGCLPDFPDRAPQGDYPEREPLE